MKEGKYEFRVSNDTGEEYCEMCFDKISDKIYENDGCVGTNWCGCVSCSWWNRHEWDTIIVDSPYDCNGMLRCNRCHEERG